MLQYIYDTCIYICIIYIYVLFIVLLHMIFFYNILFYIYTHICTCLEIFPMILTNTKSFLMAAAIIPPFRRSTKSSSGVGIELWRCFGAAVIVVSG